MLGHDPIAGQRHGTDSNANLPGLSLHVMACIALIVCMACPLLLHSQIPAEQSILTEINQEEEISDSLTIRSHNPRRASMLSAILPGAGQAYNRRYWKIPIVYAGFGAVAYAVHFNNTNYRKWRTAYIAREDGNPDTVDDFPLHSTDFLLRAMNFYRRNLEISWLAGAAVYVLNILDASVDAHLMDFDVGENLALQIRPVSIRTGQPGFGSGLGGSLTLRFQF